MVTMGRNISELNEWYASKLSFPALVRQSDHFVVPLLSLRLEIVTPGQEADPGGFASAAAPRGGVSPHTLPALVRQWTNGDGSAALASLGNQGVTFAIAREVTKYPSTV